MGHTRVATQIVFLPDVVSAFVSNFRVIYWGLFSLRRYSCLFIFNKVDGLICTKVD